MPCREDLRLSVRALVTHPAESLLLSLSVALAVGSTVIGVTLVGAISAVSDELLSSLRYREIVVSTRIDRSRMDQPARSGAPNSIVLSYGELDQARSVSPAIEYAYMVKAELLRVSAYDGLQPQILNGLKVTSEFFAAHELTSAYGSIFTAAEVARGEPVMVIGSSLGATLFIDADPLGRKVKANSRVYRIVGVLERNGTVADQTAFLPTVEISKALGASDQHGVVTYEHDGPSLRFTVADPMLLEDAREQLVTHFDAAHGAGLLYVSNPGIEFRLSADRYERLVRVVAFLTVLALLIAGLYMTNMFASRAVRRRRSAGILRAMGAKTSRVLAVFLADALIVSAVGSAVGVGLGSFLLRAIHRPFGYEGGPQTGLIVVGIAISWIVITGCVLAPAVQAARASVADSIRSD